MKKRLMIEGLVQGVGYRASFAQQTTALGISGWVRNLRDGSVEACIHGEVTALEALIVWSERGPPAARVSRVNVMEIEEPAPASNKFNILPTH